MAGKQRLFAALFGAPAIFAAAVAVLSTPLYVLPNYGLVGALEGAASAYLLALTLTVVLGVPTHMLLVQENRRTARPYVFSGAAIGAVCGILLTIILAPHIGEMLGLLLATALIVCPPGGAILALLFWLIRRPDRDAANLISAAP